MVQTACRLHDCTCMLQALLYFELYTVHPSYHTNLYSCLLENGSDATGHDIVGVWGRGFGRREGEFPSLVQQQLKCSQQLTNLCLVADNLKPIQTRRGCVQCQPDCRGGLRLTQEFIRALCVCVCVCVWVTTIGKECNSNNIKQMHWVKGHHNNNSQLGPYRRTPLSREGVSPEWSQDAQRYGSG